MANYPFATIEPNTGVVQVPEGAHVAAVLSGGNIDLQRLRSLL